MDFKTWAASLVAQMSEEEVSRVLYEGAEWYADRLRRRGTPYVEAEDRETLVEEIERLCFEREVLVEEKEGSDEALE
jgi:hypothetical protein